VRPGVREVIGLVIDYTRGEKGRPEWTQPQFSRGREITFQKLCADTLVRSVDSVSRDLVEAEAKGMIRSKITGRTKLYQAVPENFSIPEPTRKPRVLSMRKGPVSESVTELTHHHEVVAVNEPQETGRNNGEDRPVLSKSNSECFEEVESRTSAPSADVSPLEKERLGWPATPQPEMEELEFNRYCLQTITPKLASVPPKNMVTAALEALGGAPVKMLESRIALKLPKITAWGMIVLLARDVQEAWKALGVPIPGRSLYRLDEHWASSAEVRRLHADPLTPALIKREILLMWPELGAKKTKKQESAESTERLFRWADEMDRLYPPQEKWRK
jgi:hypothetical protein